MLEKELSDGVLTLTLAHGKVNALDLELQDALCESLDVGDDVRSVVITGSGRAFSAGINLKRLVDGGAPYIQHYLQRMNIFCYRLLSVEVPLVMAINGHAVAGGAIIALAGDSRIMSSGTIGVPEMLVGLPFPSGPLEIVRARIPPHTVEALVYSGACPQAPAALEAGLIDEVVPAGELMAVARARALTYAAIPRETFRLTKLALRRPALERLQASASYDAEVLDYWTRPATLDLLRDYIRRKL